MICRSRQLVLLVSVLALASGCGVFAKGETKGKLESKGGALGDWVLSGGACFSGQRENYFGVVGFGAEGSGTSVKLIKDPVRGYSAVVNIPSTCATQAEKSDCRAVVINESDCDAFEAAVTRTNTTVNDIRKLDARLTLDCKLSGGGTLKGSLTFDGCH